MKTAQYLSDRIKCLQVEDHVWLTHGAWRLKITPPRPFLRHLASDSGRGLTAFVKGRGRIRLCRIWRHGTGDRIHVRVLGSGCFFRTNDGNVIAIVVEQRSRKEVTA